MAIRKALLLTLIIVATTIFVGLGRALLRLRHDAKQSNVAEFRTTQGGYEYTVKQRPALAFAGRPVTFDVRVTRDGLPISGRQFQTEIEHANGYFIHTPPPQRNVPQATLTSDADGRYSFSFTSSDPYPLPDIYGFDTDIVLTDDEEREYLKKFEEHKIGPKDFSVDFEVYPKWLAWPAGR